jgi:hypothetical protein
LYVSEPGGGFYFDGAPSWGTPGTPEFEKNLR